MYARRYFDLIFFSSLSLSRYFINFFSFLKAFGREFQHISGYKNIFNQLKILLLKRVWLFSRRLVLALLILFVPFLLELIISVAIQSETYFVDYDVVKVLGTNNLKITNYKPFTLPFYISNDDANQTARSHFLQYFDKSRLPNVDLLELKSDNINEYVLELRKSDPYKNLVMNYFGGLSLNYSNNLLYSKIYFSSMAHHSSASLINEMNNFNLFMMTNKSNRSITTLNKPLKANMFLSMSNNYIEFLACLDVLPVSTLSFLNLSLIHISQGIVR